MDVRAGGFNQADDWGGGWLDLGVQAVGCNHADDWGGGGWLVSLNTYLFKLEVVIMLMTGGGGDG